MKKINIYKTKKNRASVLMLSLVFTALFAVTAIGIAAVVSYQNKLAAKKVDWHNALSIAEAGINYYRWHLAHDPNDLQDGTTEPGPYLHDYNDPNGSTVGQFSLEIAGTSLCTNTMIIKSTGWTNNSPHTKRSIQVSYGQKSLASFAFLTNTDVWFGEEETLHGPVHSNGGIRQDGHNDSVISSAKETYTCQEFHGCATGGESKPGVWGGGEQSSLWQYPIASIDFDSLIVSLNDLETAARTYGLYLGNSGLGYHINFKEDGTFDLYQVKKLRNPVWGYNTETWHKDSWDIQNETFIANHPIPSECAIIFVEDNVWVDGIVNGHVTVVAAKLPEVPNNRRHIIINGNITYYQKDGTASLGLVAQQDILIPLYSAPENLEINAALIAQRGHVYRMQYLTDYWPYNLRNSILVYGSIISNQVWTWSWIDNSQTTISGYQNSTLIYDPYLTHNPPPGFPTTDAYKILRWEETTEKE